MNIISIKEYAERERISERTAYRRLAEGKERKVQTGDGTMVVRGTELDDGTLNAILEKKKEYWNTELRRGHVIYKRNMKSSAETTAIIEELLEDVRQTEKLTGKKVKGYDRRSLQMKIKSGKTERKMRADKFGVRNRMLKNDITFNKALDFIYKFYVQDSLHSLSGAIDRALYEAKKYEEYWELVPLNFFTLRRQITNCIHQSGCKDLAEYMNHRNLHKKKYAYVQGAFTDDIGFMEVYSLDDHKPDVAGAIVINEMTGKKEQKKIYSWVCIEMKTMMILGYEIKIEPFSDPDIIRMMMKVLRKWGAPKRKVICDQGLCADQWVKDFFTKLGIVLEPQEEYSPTKKANNERIFRFFKSEVDAYCENFVGSNHPVEGRHRGKQLSPEETTELATEAVKRYDKYISEYYMDKPRKRAIQGINTICDNTGRVSIKKLFDFYSNTHEKIEVSERQMRYAYLKNDAIKPFDGYYMKFKGELYLPEDDISLVLYDREYRYTIAYNPDDLNTIDLYAAQDILDRITGQYIEQGEYVCSLSAIRVLDADEKAKAVTVHNKRIKKAQLELARAYREKDGNIVNLAINGDGALVDVKKQQEKAIEAIIKNEIPVERIEAIVNNVKVPKQTFDKIETMTLEGLEKIDVE